MPKYTQPRKTWFYPVNFKIKAVKLSLRDDVMSKEVAEALNIHPLMLSRWRKEYRNRNKKMGSNRSRICYQPMQMQPF